MDSSAFVELHPTSQRSLVPGLGGHRYFESETGGAALVDPGERRVIEIR
jgi:hypothetical protein